MQTITRTDEDRAAGSPFPVSVGGKAYPVRPLTIKHSREWKKSLSRTLGGLGELKFDDVMAGNVVNTEALKRAIDQFAVAMPDLLVNLVVGYLELAKPSFEGGTTVREWVEDNASDEEITDALWTMLQVTFPFLWRVGDLAKVVGALQAPTTATRSSVS